MSAESRAELLNLPFPTKVYRCEPSGMCAGVDQALRFALNLHEQNKINGLKTTMIHEVGHYKPLVDMMKAKGITHVESPEEADPNSVLIFSPHGSPPRFEHFVVENGREAYNTICPLVKRVEDFFDEHIKNGYYGIHIGKADHVETKALTARAPGRVSTILTKEQAESIEVPNPDKVVVTIQTTLPVDEALEIAKILERRFRAVLPRVSHLCYATQWRQGSLKHGIEKIKPGAVLIIGDQKSSNTKSLYEVACSYQNLQPYRNMNVHFVLESSLLKREWFIGIDSVIITGGASVLPEKITEVEQWFVGNGSKEVKKIQYKDESKIVFNSITRVGTN